ncbi:hypothetical protein K469DRAFT_723103 [Zopfia rhizophila CBS 207.26]|uniref:RTA1-domain-containing protein n=1 Tax=Zopfia rhizophila CBS 207.26 TaxID=1314779 RepID=A0A6A6EE09_9PEZI|nr:hypothetical protein K469DRAFT_723103 [Zopfia rhizophila CBS 207.26]
MTKTFDFEMYHYIASLAGAIISIIVFSLSWTPFIVQGCFILIGSLFFAATIYMMLGQTIRLAGGEEVSILKLKWCTRIFDTADVSTLVVQGLGEKIVRAGLAMQVVIFVAFIIILYSVSSLILAHCIFRLVEYGMGNASYPMAREWCLYVFDTALMALVLIMLFGLQPAKYAPEKNKRLGSTDVEELDIEQSA